MRRSLMLVLVLSTSCALNAVLEVEMQLPAGARPFAFVEVVRGRIPEACSPPDSGVDAGPDDCFSPSAIEAESRWFRLTDSDINLCAREGRRCNVRFSVVSEDVSLEALHIRVNLCAREDCLGPGDDRPPYYLFEIARPFYRGKRTRWSPNRAPYASRVTLEPQPAMREERRYVAHRCEVEGCFDGNDINDATFGWCRGPTTDCTDVGCRGQHFCE